jgi:drug/metabolite transporter (DMT)-like permease
MLIIYTKLVFTAIFWGGTFVAGRIVTREVEPYSAAFLRFLFASAFLIMFRWKVTGQFKLPYKKNMIPLVLLGLTGVFSYNVFFFLGLERIEAGRASIIIANNPVLIAFFAAVFFKERLNRIAVAGIILSVAGALVVITKGDFSQVVRGDIGLGEFYIFCCVLSWVSYSLIGKAVLNDLSPLDAVTWSSVIGMAALSVPACIEGLQSNIFGYSIESWVCIFYLGFFGTVIGFVWYYSGINEIGPSRASQFISLVPVSAISMGALILNEVLSVSLLIGAVLVLSGLSLTNNSILISDKIKARN